MAEHEKVIYSARNGGCGYAKGQVVGTLVYGWGFQLRFYPHPQEEVIRFSLLPDDYVLRGGHGEITTMSKLRKTLRSWNNFQIGIDSNFGSTTNYIFPASDEDIAYNTLTNLLQRYPISDYHEIVEFSSIRYAEDATNIYDHRPRIYQFKVSLCRYRDIFADCGVKVSYSQKNGWWRADSVEIIVHGQRRFYICQGAKGDHISPQAALALLTIPVDPKPQRKEGPRKHGYYGVRAVREHGQHIGTYYPEDVPDKLHPRVMPEIPEGYELVGISNFDGQSIAPILSEPQEYEDHVVNLRNNTAKPRWLELFLLCTEDLVHCPNTGAVKEEI